MSKKDYAKGYNAGHREGFELGRVRGMAKGRALGYREGRSDRDYIAVDAVAPHAEQELIDKLGRLHRELSHDLGREPEAWELAKEMDIPVAKVREIQRGPVLELEGRVGDLAERLERLESMALYAIDELRIRHKMLAHRVYDLDGQDERYGHPLNGPDFKPEDRDDD